MSTKTAVVIDDEIDLTTYLTTILENDGFIVKSANDAVTGEQLIKEVSPDIILIDLMMPGRTGIQLFSRLRTDDKTKDIPLVMVTGIKEQTGIDWGEIVDRYKTRRPDGFVEKPIDPERLLGVVHGALAGQGGNTGILHG
jgi:two-component system, OmpR family, phosphate regulon response regulator PhoB